MPALDKNYKPADHEPAISSRWKESGAFHADPTRVVNGQAKPYGIVIPPPNVTGRLHLGHALNNTIQDVLTRAHRMMGFETLWMPGTDHAGIATQAVVEKRLLQEENKRRNDFTREEFVARVQQWKDEYEATITDQLKKMGCSCDFDRQRFTMDDICARAVREAFFRLFKDGLIYRGKRLVNWDPQTQTALADDEVVMEEIEGAFYYLRYPLVRAMGNNAPITWSELARLGYPGADQHAPNQQAWVTVATTRPETYLGDTAVAINPDDPRAKALKGMHVELPLVGRVIPIIEDSYVVMPAKDPNAEGVDPKAKFATGFLKVTPAHDPNDYDIGQRHKLDMINIMAPDASISDKHGWPPGDVGDAHLFIGKSREDARQLVISEFKSRTFGITPGTAYFEKQVPYRHSVGHSDRSGAAIEPYLSDQWYVKVTDDRMRGSALRSMNPAQHTGTPVAHAPGSSERSSDGDGTLTFFPERYSRTFQTWHENLRDWCISRQLWWGHRIPVWKKRVHLDERNWTTELAGKSGIDSLLADTSGTICARITRVSTGEAVNPKSDLNPVVASTVGEYDLFICSTTDAMSHIERYGFERDPDVLDTWFSSALWPISTMGWPDAAAAVKDEPKNPDFAALLKAYNPTNVLCTAREIITLWVSRMVMFNRYFMGEGAGNGPVPFRDVFIHAMIQDGEGQKMSKSLGNGVDPLDIVESHGADAMRYVLCDMTTQTQDVRMPVDILCPHCTKSFPPKTITNQAGYVVAAPVQNCPHCSKSSVSSYGVASAAAKPDAKIPAAKNTSAKFDKGRNFCTKLWNASRFAMMILEEAGGEGTNAGAPVSTDQFTQVDRWMLHRLATQTAKINDALKNYEFNVYAQALYELLWWDFCDWYLEAIKPTVRTSPAQQAVLRASLDCILRLLHPVIPFVTEAIWSEFKRFQRAPVAGLNLGPTSGQTTDMLCKAPWPTIDASLAGNPALAKADAEFGRVKGLVEAIRQARSAQGVEPRRKITLHAPSSLTDLIQGAGSVVETLCGLEKVVGAGSGSNSGATAVVVFEGQELLISNLKDAVDPSVERAALTESLTKMDKDIAVLEQRLNNPGYADKAPAKMVQDTRDQLARKSAERDAMRRRLTELG